MQPKGKKKRHITYRGIKISMKDDLPGMMEVRRQWNDPLKVLKG